MSRRSLSILLVNQSWLRDELRSRGHRVLVIGCGEGDFDINTNSFGCSYAELVQFLPPDFIPDALVYHDNSGTPWFYGVEQIQIPKVFYSVDTHHHHGWHPSFATLFDEVFVAQKDYLADFRALSIEPHWFPGWAMRAAQPLPHRPTDVCFRGTLDTVLHPNRAKFISELKKLVDVDAGPGDWVPAYGAAKIVVNETVRADLNFRVFEAMESGALLITPLIENGLLDIFSDGVHLVTYERGNHVDAAEKIRHYLTHASEREAIAKNGRNYVAEHHSAVARAAELESVLYRLLDERESGVARAPHPLMHLHAARSYLATATLLRSFGPELTVPFLLAAALNLDKSAAAREQEDSHFVSTALLCFVCLEECGMAEIAIELLRSIRTAYPTDVILALTEVEKLITQGRMDEALKLAAEVSQSPEDLLKSASTLLAGVRVQIADQLSSLAAFAEAQAE